MAETVKLAAQYVEQGHVRVGPNTVTDPGFLVSRQMEDFVTWTDGSKIRRTIAKVRIGPWMARFVRNVRETNWRTFISSQLV
eukprot:scaffold8015_cov277-Pinguiococcus_pyrenoidosus.AAC.3